MGVVVCTSQTKIISQGGLLFTQFAVVSTFDTSQSDICTKWETSKKSPCPILEILLPGATSLNWLSQSVEIVSKSSNKLAKFGKSLRCRPETTTTSVHQLIYPVRLFELLCSIFLLNQFVWSSRIQIGKLGFRFS